MEEIERRIWLRKVEVALEESFYRPDILPISIKNITTELLSAQQTRNHFFAEIRIIRGQRLDENIRVEKVNPHGCQPVFGIVRAIERTQHGRTHHVLTDNSRIGGFLDERTNREIIIQLHEPETGHLCLGNRSCGDGGMSTHLAMVIDQVPEIHPVELIARKNKRQILGPRVKVHQVLPHCVSRTLIPALPLFGLFGGHDIHHPAAKWVKAVGRLNVPVEGRRVELGQHINLVKPGIQAVADGNIHQAVFTGQGHCRLAAGLGQRVKTGSTPASKNDAENSRSHFAFYLIGFCR
ncbi:MAG: hypothetical protein BWY82_00978 [Verrucomicrobia bacterium ADurb.Bin474]|nr:MAG: hypothetical protein BWY82_00978 [Verrucomicrobia bacterium ADurb.Bin474]